LVHNDVNSHWLAYSHPLEGRVHWMYLDVKGLVTTGVGNLIDPPELAQRLTWRIGDSLATRDQIDEEWDRVKAMPWGLHSKVYRGHLWLSDVVIEYLVAAQLRRNEEVLRRHFEAWDQWPADAQLGALSLTWAVGAGLREWPRFRAACEARDWLRAGHESQIRTVGNPGVVARNRAQTICFRNAHIVDRGNDALDPELVWWPLELTDPDIDLTVTLCTP
jgi:hypothetical protein